MSITEHPSFGRFQTITDNFVVVVEAKQAEYALANGGKYFQGIYLVDGKPDGTEDVNMVSTRKPDDQGATWNDFDSSTFKNNVKIPVQVSISVYESPSGNGWKLRIELWKAGFGPDFEGRDGDHWVYRWHVGPEGSGGIFGQWYIEVDGEV